MDERTFSHDGATYRLTWDPDTDRLSGTLRCVHAGRVAWSKRLPLLKRPDGHLLHLDWRVLDGRLTLRVDGEHWKIGTGESYRYAMTPEGLEPL